MEGEAKEVPQGTPRMSRRKFLRVAGGALLGAAMAACKSSLPLDTSSQQNKGESSSNVQKTPTAVNYNEVRLPPENPAVSNFFKKNTTAGKILLGMETCNLEELAPICGKVERSTADFSFAFLNGLRQVGYFPTTCHEAGELIGLPALNLFKRINGLPESPIVDKVTLSVLDKQVRKAEERDLAGKAFIGYKEIPEPPPGNPSKDHLAFLYLLANNAFPLPLKIQLAECRDPQLGDPCGLGVGYYEGLGESCRPVYPSAWDSLRDDFALVAITIHEHTHYLDRKGLLDAREFFKISYHTDDFFIGKEDGWRYCKLRADPDDHEEMRQHFFSYGDGWFRDPKEDYRTTYEDLAVCVEMYVMHGRVFRDYMKDKPVFRQKYAWIKDHVFNQVEFGTGDSDYKEYASDLYLIGRGVVAPSGIARLRPDYVWDYQIPVLS